MDTWVIVLIVIGSILVLLGILAFVGNKLQKKQDASQEQMRAAAQSVSFLVIDKKKMKLKDANLPKVVLEQTPKYLRRSKVPIVKVKAGPNIMNLMCDDKIFDIIPTKKEVKATVSGIYIMDVKGLRGSIDTTSDKKKKGFFARMKKETEIANNAKKDMKNKKNGKK